MSWTNYDGEYFRLHTEIARVEHPQADEYSIRFLRKQFRTEIPERVRSFDEEQERIEAILARKERRQEARILEMQSQAFASVL
jgi:hypothetical protein